MGVPQGKAHEFMVAQVGPPHGWAVSSKAEPVWAGVVVCRDLGTGQMAWGLFVWPLGWGNVGALRDTCWMPARLGG